MLTARIGSDLGAPLGQPGSGSAATAAEPLPGPDTGPALRKQACTGQGRRRSACGPLYGLRTVAG